MPVMHVGLGYHGLDDYLEGTVPYLRASVDPHESVIVVGTTSQEQALRSELGAAAESFAFMDSQAWYDAPARAFTRYMNYWQAQKEKGFTSLRILGEPISVTTSSERLRRWVAYENAVNDVMQEFPFTMMCTYDMRLSGMEHRCVSDSHPYLASGAEIVANTDFLAPVAFDAARFATPLPFPTSDVRELDFRDEDAWKARELFAAVASEYGLDPMRISEGVIAIGEAIANAIEHGGGAGAVALFRDGDELVCDVKNDRGEIGERSRGYFMPEVDDARGRGIWIMRQICDWVEFRPSDGVTTVRLHLRLEGEHAQAV